MTTTATQVINMNRTICPPASDPHKASAKSENKMPGHWLLAKLGKRVLRPGGLALTRAMLDRLNTNSGLRDRVRPGLGRNRAPGLESPAYGLHRG